MKKFYYLSTCSTCLRILSELNLPSEFILQDIKSIPLTENDLLQLKKLAGNHENLFSRRAQLYKQRNLKDQNLSEEDFKKLILEHYTFLKRPVLINGNEIFIGNSKPTVEAAKKSINE
ncbi:MAG TPA: ArsC/Spx/MgsR family protein [Salinimicrobium sp.]|nr:ArsC/Spx/MgsR family protein [Salinimicrobium sp.]